MCKDDISYGEECVSGYEGTVLPTDVFKHYKGANMLIDPIDLEIMTKEELAEAKFQTEQMITEYEAQKTVLNQSLIAKMKELNTDGAQWGGYDVVYKFRRGNFDVSLERAEELDATEIVVKASTKKLTALEKEGIVIPRKPNIEWVEVKPS